MTEPDDSLHVVFGAAGAIGGAVVTELLRAGGNVRAVSRGGQAPEGAQGVAADASRTRPRRPARRPTRSVVYHCASPRYTQWPELFPALTGSILGAAVSSGAKLVFCRYNLYAYGPVDGLLREDLPAVARGRKGRTRVEMAAQLLGAHRDGRARVVIGRASDYYGPRGTGSTAGETVFGGSSPERSRNGPDVSTSRTPSTTCLTSPAVCWSWLTARKQTGRSGICQRPGR